MMETLSFFVPGLPQTAGSKRAFPIARKGVNGERIYTGKNIVVDANPKTKDWKARIAHQAELVMDLPVNRQLGLWSGALAARFTFHLPRIGGHYRSNGELKPGVPARPTVRPDVLKLTRAAEDALTGVVWFDDSQIVLEVLEKRYSDKPGLLVEVFKLNNLVDKKPEAMELKLEGL